MDWKPERVVQAKFRDFQTKKNYCWSIPVGRHSAPVYKWRLLPDSLVNNGLYLPGGIISTLCRASPRQRLNLFTIISSSKKFAECLYYDVSPPPILPVLSRFIESHLSYTVIQLYGHTKLYIHPYKLHSYNHTLILSRIHTLMHTQHIHSINSHVFASVTQNLVWVYLFSLVLNYRCAKQQVPTNGQLALQK